MQTTVNTTSHSHKNIFNFISSFSDSRKKTTYKQTRSGN